MHPGDKVIIITYADYEDAELDGFEPAVVHVDAENNALPTEPTRPLEPAPSR